jgi:DNA-binding Lrp family transcriptional regulator
MEDEWERKQAVAGAMVDFLEGWVVRELCMNFRIMADAVYAETLEHRLLKVLAEDEKPQSLLEMASRSGVSRTLMTPERRLRRAIERMERSGIVLRTGPDERPRYSLNPRNLAGQMLRMVYERPKSADGLVASSLREVFGPRIQE